VNEGSGRETHQRLQHEPPLVGVVVQRVDTNATLGHLALAVALLDSVGARLETLPRATQHLVRHWKAEAKLVLPKEKGRHATLRVGCRLELVAEASAQLRCLARLALHARARARGGRRVAGSGGCVRRR
jgi:hypothetical protein